MRSLSLKLTLAFLFVGLIGAVLVALFVGFRTQREFDRFVLNAYERNMLESITALYEDNGSWDGIETIVVRNPFRRQGREFAKAPITLINTDGEVIYSARKNQEGQQIANKDLNKTLPVEIDGEIVGYLQFTAPGMPARRLRESPESQFLKNFNQAVVLGAAGATLLALIVGILLARSITRPIRKLTVATQAVAEGELGRQVDVRNRDEIGELADSFNQMSSDLARGQQLRRQMTADIAHDLRTPLSVILGYTEALTDGKFEGTPETYDIMHDEALHLQHLIDDLRTLTLADSGELTLDRQACNPMMLLERTAVAFAAQAEKRNIDLHVDDNDEDIPNVEVDPERMIQVLNNLVSNALRFTADSGKISLSAAADPQSVYLRVQDNGAGIAPDDLPNIFARFYRGDEARNVEEGESGLGLAIAKSLTEAQGGKIRATSKLGEGTTFIVALPV